MGINLSNCKTLDKHTTKGVVPPEHFAALDAWGEMVRSGRVHRFKETALHGQFASKIVEGVLGYHGPSGGAAYTLSAEQNILRSSVDLALGRFRRKTQEILATHNTPAAPAKKRECCTPEVVSFGRCSTPSAGHFCTLFYIMLADSHYGSPDKMALAKERSIDLTAPARTAKGGSSGRLTLEDFSLNTAGLVLECPSGVAPVSKSAANAKLQARFDLATCRKCPDRGRCPVQANKHDGQFARFQYTPKRAENQKRRLQERSDAFRDIYRWRAGIEATMSRLKHQMNLAHLRVRGMPAMRYTVNMRALGLNIRGRATIQA